jgi:hypothetical protein
MAGFVKEAVAQRVGGDRPSPVKASFVAIATGAAAALVAYRVLRS